MAWRPSPIRPWNGWSRHAGTMTRAKPDRRGAGALADLVCTQHRNLGQVAGGTLWAEAIKVLARAPKRAAARGRYHSAVRALTSQIAVVRVPAGRPVPG
jgi:hypothetical protein